MDTSFYNLGICLYHYFQMKFFIFILIILSFALAIACVPSAAPVAVSNRRLDPGETLIPPGKNIEEMGWTGFDDKVTKLKDLRGKVVVLDFWATYCPPCIEEMPHLVSLQQKNPGLQVIGLHVGGPEDRPKVPRFIEKFNINYPLATPEDDLSRALLGGDSRIPQTVIFDKSGKLVTKIVGFDAAAKKTLDETLEKELAK